MINTEGWAVRLAEPRDYGPIGDLLCEAYVAAGLEAPGGDYLPLMRDVAGRVADPRARVVVAVTSGTHGEEAVIGCVTLCGHGSGLTKVCLPGEFEFRMLGVDARWRRAGVAAALVNACDEVGADLGLTTSIGCAWEGNAAAMALYGRLGFSRLPERDHHYSPAEFLHVFGRQARFCGQCGRSPRIADHSRCEIAEKLEPPRFCQECRRRMKVQVLPTGWVARCSRHGELRG